MGKIGAEMTNQNSTKNMTCPNCGTKIPVAKSAVGRKRLNIPFKNVCEALQLYQDTGQAARELRCSVGYIYGACKEQGTYYRVILISSLRLHTSSMLAILLLMMNGLIFTDTGTRLKKG